MKKILILLILHSTLLFPFILKAEEVAEAKIILQELIREALEKNPRVEASIQRALAAERAIPQAGALPDPKITLGLMNLPVRSFAFDEEPMTGKLVSVMQMFPFPGKLSLSEDMAVFEAAAVKHQQEEVRNQVIHMVKRAYYDLYAMDRAIETVQRNKGLMEQLVRVAEVKYATGLGLQQDVLRAQVELSKLEDELIMWQKRRDIGQAKMNEILNRPADSPFATTSPELLLPEGTLPSFTAQEIEEKRPLLRAWREMIKKAEAAVKLSRRDLWPNITLGVSFNQRDDLESGMAMQDFFSASVTLDIPLFFKRKQKERIAQKELDLKAVLADYGNVRISVLAEIESLKAELERNRKRVELFGGGILLQARQSLESAQAGYQVGKVDFLTVIDNWMRLLGYELQYYFAIADYHKAMASYELAVGEEIVIGNIHTDDQK